MVSTRYDPLRVLKARSGSLTASVSPQVSTRYDPLRVLKASETRIMCNARIGFNPVRPVEGIERLTVPEVQRLLWKRFNPVRPVEGIERDAGSQWSAPPG